MALPMVFKSDVDVSLVDSMGNDLSIIKSAIVSTGGELGKYEDFEAAYGLINYLMQHRHGTPFEHAAMTFYVNAPIFVWREWHRHRVGFSYNETSARYKQLEPVFWIPDRERPLLPSPIHKSARPDFERMDSDEKYKSLKFALEVQYTSSYQTYELLLTQGLAKEVARTVLPVGIYSQCYVTCNPRSLMHFLGLRTKDERATFKSYPQMEIQEAANKLEREFSGLFPMTHKAFNENGRVAP